MILITRPLENAEENVNFLKTKKINYFLHPLTKLSVKNKSLKIKNEILIISSYKVIEFLKKNNNVSIIRNCSFLIVGNKTSQYLKGLKYNVLFTASNSEILSKYIKKNLKKSVKLKFLCSNIYNKDFVKELRRDGFSLQLTRVYQTHEETKLSLKLQKHLHKKEIRKVLFYSSFAVKVFFKLIKLYKIDVSYLDEIIYMCLSKRIAESIPQKYYDSKKVIVPKKTSNALEYFLKQPGI